MKYLYCLFFSIGIFAQQKPLELVIDSLKSVNSKDQREFVLHYHITNHSDQEVAFALNTKNMIPIASGSLRPSPYYKIYENGRAFEATGILSSRGDRRTFESEKALEVYLDSLKNYHESRTEEQLLDDEKQRFMGNIQKLAARETRKFEIRLLWDRQRYHKNDAIEYYIGEKERYEFEIHAHLMAEELLMDFPKDQQQQILKGLKLTKGWYTSNRVLIDFGE